MKNFLLTITLSITLASSAWAGPRSWQQAKAIASQQADKLGVALTESNITAAKVKGQTTASSNSSYYVFTNKGESGYIIVAGDDVMPDIVGYSTNGTYDESQMPANFKDFLDAYDATVKAVQRGDKSAISAVTEAKILREAKQTNVVAPLLGKENINYDQETPYNLTCPTYKGEDGSDVKTITGCAATAMAQILRYYKYPAATTATIPAYTTKAQKIQMPAIPAGTTFDWDHMLSVYKKKAYTDEEANAVANLMLCCGCAMEMNYDTESGANPTTECFTKYFGYDEDLIQYVSRYAFTLKQWTDIIDAELAAERPIYYVGYTSDGGGHAFVCDGADANGLYHINWGWNGSQDGYFDISLMNPQKGGSGSGDDSEGYTRECAMFIGLAPDNGKVDTPLVEYPDITLKAFQPESDDDDVAYSQWTTERADASQPFQGVINCSITNVAKDTFFGIIAFGYKNSDGTYTILDKGQVPGLPTLQSVNCTVKIEKCVLPVGKIEILPLYSTDNGTSWHVCGMENVTPIILNVTETALEQLPAIEVTATYADKDFCKDVPNTATFHVKSNMDEEYNGTFILAAQDKYVPMMIKSIGSLFISLKAGEEKDLPLPVSVPFIGTGSDHEVMIALFDATEGMYYSEYVKINESETPVLKLISIETNVDQTETSDKAQMYVSDDDEILNFIVPQVKHDKLTVTYSLQNSASKPGAVKYALIATNPLDTDIRQGGTSIVRNDGNDNITKLTIEADPAILGNNILVKLYLYSEKDKKYLNTIDTDLPNVIYTSTTGKSASLPAYNVWAYVTGDPTDISAVTTDNGDMIGGGDGVIIIKAAQAKHIDIYNLSGQKVAEANLHAGEQQTISMHPGIYIAGGKKVAVK